MVRVITNDGSCCEITLSPSSYNLINLSCKGMNTNLSPSITAIDLSSRTKKGDLLHSIIGAHEIDENAHKTLFSKKADISALSNVATSGNYNDLTNKPIIPEIPEINNGTLTITQNGTTKGTFRANQNENTTIEISTDLNGKADVDLSNTNNQAKILMSGMGMPSTRYIDLTLGASGATYTMPSNGWLYCSASQTGTSGFIYIENQTRKYAMQTTVVSGVNQNTTVPVCKNDVISISYVGCSLVIARFIYAQGTESEAQ